MKDGVVVERWAQRLSDFLPGHIAAHPLIGSIGTRAAMLLHGSTTAGIDDQVSDLDVWLLVEDQVLNDVDARAGTRFFEFTLDGKSGHFNFESQKSFEARVRRCDFPLIAELRRARILRDPGGKAEELITRARKPMPADIQRTWFAFHYVQMRSDHKMAAGPMVRGDAIAIFQAAASCIGEALRAAMILDGVPYPYVKWLGREAATTPTGSTVAEKVNAFVSSLASDALRVTGAKDQHPINDGLTQIRKVLIDAARGQSINEPWLDKWWLYLTQSREGIARTEWA